MTSGAMTEQAFFILTALAGKPLHGYGIVADVKQLSENRVHLKIGTLYGVLERLVKSGLVELDREETHQGRLRRYYRLTNSGHAALSAEVKRLEMATRAAQERLHAHQHGDTQPRSQEKTAAAPTFAPQSQVAGWQA